MALMCPRHGVQQQNCWLAAKETAFWIVCACWPAWRQFGIWSRWHPKCSRKFEMAILTAKLNKVQSKLWFTMSHLAEVTWRIFFSFTLDERSMAFSSWCCILEMLSGVFVYVTFPFITYTWGHQVSFICQIHAWLWGKKYTSVSNDTIWLL